MSNISTSVSSLALMTGSEVSAAIRSGDVSARDVTEACIRRIESVDPRLNAVVVPLFEQALQQADQLDFAQVHGTELGPLHGIPVTIKESIEIAGTPSTLGLTGRRQHRAAEDSFQVKRLKQAGAIVMGKTNISLLLKAYETDNPV